MKAFPKRASSFGFQVSYNLLYLQGPQVEVKHTSVCFNTKLVRKCLTQLLSNLFRAYLLLQNKCMTEERLRVDLHD